MWQLETGIPFSTNKFECGFVDSVNDVSWNNIYNMNALSGFGQEYPLLVYIHERKDAVSIDESEIKEALPNEEKKPGIFKPILQDTKALIWDDDKKYNNNIDNSSQLINNINNNSINNSNYNVDNVGIDDELHNVLPDDYLPKPTKK